jgi:hypothetical protein
MVIDRKSSWKKCKGEPYVHLYGCQVKSLPFWEIHNMKDESETSDGEDNSIFN